MFCCYYAFLLFYLQATRLLVNLFTRQLVNSQTTFLGKRGWRQ